MQRIYLVAADELQEAVDPRVDGGFPLLEDPRVRAARTGLREEAVRADRVGRVGQVGGAPRRGPAGDREREAVVQQRAEEARAQPEVVHPREGDPSPRARVRGGARHRGGEVP